MRRLAGSRPMLAMIVLLLSATALAACSGGPPKGPVSSGVRSRAFGGIDVVGYLTLSGTQADVWDVSDIKPGPSSVIQPKTLATLRAGSVDGTGIKALEGRYIWASGRRTGGSDGVPQIRVDGIDLAQEP